MNVRDWLPPMIRTWAREKQRIATGCRVVPPSSADENEGKHFDGWPSTSICASMFEGGRGGPVHQHFPEVFEGEALVIWRALVGAPIEVFEVIHVHYLTPPPTHRRAAQLGLSERAYYNQLERAYFYLAGRIERADWAQNTVQSPRPMISRVARI